MFAAISIGAAILTSLAFKFVTMRSQVRQSQSQVQTRPYYLSDRWYVLLQSLPDRFFLCRQPGFNVP